MASASDLALVQGLAHTRTTLRRWNAAPWPVLRAWLLGALAIAAALLAAVLALSLVLSPDVVPLGPSGLRHVRRVGELGDVGEVLARNALVLALHALACVAGFIAGSSLPEQSARYSGRYRRVHDRAGPLAIAFVVGATAFSLISQAVLLGTGAATLAAQAGMSPALLLLGLLPHALPELVALFLPLAAWILASRRGDWHELLAATLVTVALAVPLLVLAACIEVYVSPTLVAALRG